MATNTFFSVNGGDLDRLNSTEAVEALASLIRIEAWRLQIPMSGIDVPRAVTVTDGGIDAAVQNPTGQAGLGIIKVGLTRYQVKTGAFSLSDEGELKHILFKPSARRDGGRFVADDMQPRVRTCIERNGTLVIALFGSDTPDQTDERLLLRFRELLGEVEESYANANIEIWRQNQLIGFIEHFPSLALSIRNVPQDTYAVPHKLWMQQSDLDGTFVVNDDNQKVINDIQAALLESSERSIHIRFVGEPGIGKTRLIYEATKHETLQPLVVYSEDAEQLIESEFLNRLLNDVSRLNLILIADECRPEARAILRRKFRHQAGTVRVVSIYNEEDEGDSDREYRYYDAPRLDAEKIAEIICQYGIPEDDANFWAKECDGSPRVANVVGKNLVESDDVLRGDGLVRIWDRYIAGMEDPQSDKARRARFILRCIGLFKKVGVTGPKKEIDEVYNLVMSPLDRALSLREFTDIVSEFRRRKILQGQHVLYITPKLLHIRLWCEWWEAFGSQFAVGSLLSTLSAPLAQWFIDMLIYAKESPASEAVAKELLGPSGPLYKNEWLNTRTGGALFFNLAQVEPRAALRCLIDTLGSKTVDELRNFKAGRFEVVQALRMLATYEPHFRDSALLLLRLAEAETENYSNNASGIFTDLFTLGYGRGATSALPPAGRLQVLQTALNSSSEAQRALAIDAVDKALHTQFTQIALDERHGLRRLPSRWTPKTYGEIFLEYERYWTFLRESMSGLAKDEQVRSARIFVQRARDMFSIESMRALVIDTLRSIERSALLPFGAVLEAAIAIQHYDAKSYPLEIQDVLNKFIEEMQGSGYSATLKRYVGLGLLEDQFDENGEETKEQKRRVVDLAVQSLDEPSLLRKELPWLVTREAKNGHKFGVDIGLRDKTLSLWPDIKTAWRNQRTNANDFFVGGYLHGVFQTDPLRWETTIRELAKEDVFLLPEVIWRSGITEPIADLLTWLVESNVIPVERLQLFSYGGASKNISARTICRWIELLIAQKERTTAEGSIELFDYRFRPGGKDEEEFPVDLALKVLTQEALLEPDEHSRNHTMPAYHWAKLGKRLIKVSSEKAVTLARWILVNLGARGSFVSEYGSPTLKVLTDITKQYPIDVWNIATQLLTVPLDRRAFNILQWLRGEYGFREKAEDGALCFIPRDAVWEWIEAEPDPRAYLVAEYCPKKLRRAGTERTFAVELLERYGDRDDVRSGFSANFNSGGWSGPTSVYYQEKIDTLRELLAAEENVNVRTWLQSEISSLEDLVAHERINEERGT